MYEVTIKRKTLKSIRRMPENIQMRMANLAEDLRDKGPMRNEWPNFSKLGKDEFHCHLSHSWVACWSSKRSSLAIEVYYAGSREDAPY